jgi:amidase
MMWRAVDDRRLADLRKLPGPGGRPHGGHAAAQWAIPLAKSKVPEFAGSHTFNPLWGVTRNPWNLGRTSGGSSGGAAAALAAQIWLANGSCLGGSLRIPASFRGVVGMRPSPGVVPRGDGLPAFDSLWWVEGPMARTVSDLALMLDAMAKPTPHDPLSLPVPAGGFQAMMCKGGAPKRVGFSANLGLRSVDPDVAALCESAVRRLTDIGCAVESEAPDFSGAIDSFQVLRALLFACQTAAHSHD